MIFISDKDIETTRKVVLEEFEGVVFKDSLGYLISKLQDKVSYSATIKIVEYVLVNKLNMSLR